MHRRTFLKAAGAALLLPSVMVSQRKSPEIDLSLFCDGIDDPQMARYDLVKPFFQDGWTYATDSRVCVRTTTILPAAQDVEARLPRMSTLAFWGADGFGWKKWPSVALVESEGRDKRGQCPICFYKGRVGDGVVLCKSCKGYGVQYLLGVDDDDAEFYEKPCAPCSKTGWIGGVECDYCGGNGITDKPHLQVVGDLRIAPYFDQKIRTLQDVEFKVFRKYKEEFGEKSSVFETVCFRFNGGEGAVMPIVYEG